MLALNKHLIILKNITKLYSTWSNSVLHKTILTDEFKNKLKVLNLFLIPTYQNKQINSLQPYEKKNSLKCTLNILINFKIYLKYTWNFKMYLKCTENYVVLNIQNNYIAIE